MSFYGENLIGVQQNLAIRAATGFRCDDCNLCQSLSASRSAIVFPTPCPPYGLLAIGEAPGAEEDELGEGFVGQAGRTLDELLASHGIERNRDYGVANLVRCRPPRNRKPTRDELEHCLLMLASFLQQSRPKVLLLVGAVAVRAFMGTGSLMWQMTRHRQMPILLAKDAHPHLQPAIRALHDLVGGVYGVPMPHTSGLAWNRKAPDGRLWREWGAGQVALAAKLLHLQGRSP